jgi:arylsulfatase A-like enzyme
MLICRKQNGYLHMSKKLKTVFIALIMLSSSLIARERPNVLFIMVDDLNTDVGFLGDIHAKTPNLDELAEQAVVFTNAHCQAPICGPSRNSLLTGKYPHNTGLYSLDPMFRDVEELEELVSLPQFFRENGYSSPNVGKIYHTKPDGLSFDTVYGWYGAFGPFPDETIHLDPDLPVHPYYDWGPFLTEPETADAKVAQKAVQLIKEHSDDDRPFFLSVGFFRPHCPLYAPQEWFDMHPLENIEPASDQSADMEDISPYARKLVRYESIQRYNNWLLDGRSASFLQAYRSCVSFSDHCVGKVLDALRESGEIDNTIIVLCGDHGVHNGRKNIWYKRTLWDASTHVALVIKAPGYPARRVQAPAGLIDIYPTLCKLAGLQAPGDIDGLSLEGLMAGRSEKHPPALTSHGPGNFSLHDENWHYIRYADGSEELYDHRSDPDEYTNLADRTEMTEIIARFDPFIPKEWKPFAPGSKGIASPHFPGK